MSMMIRGVDGCKAGWLCLSVCPGETRPTAAVYEPDARALLAEHALVVAIDIPIGLPSSGSRPVDGKARRLLGPLRCSVFPAPVRACLCASSYEDACEKSEQACGKKISRQTYGILPKIRDVDALLRETPGLRTTTFEVHPEVCFVHWSNLRSPRHPKKSGFGFMERLGIVQAVYGSAPSAVRDEVPRSQAADDDILDAFAALWTAQRIHDGRAVAIDGADKRDEYGLPMEMWA